MNKLELVIYNWVKNNPILKQRIVDVYQGVLGVIPQPKIVTDYPYVERPGYFYGFHDKSPFSSDGDFLLAHKNIIGNRLVQSGDKAVVGYFSGSDWGEFEPLGETDAWNWQLGSMLQWYGAGSRQAVYNTFVGDRHVAVIRDLCGERKGEHTYPVVHVAPSGGLTCSYDFARVEAAMPGYGCVSASPSIGTMKDNYFRIFSTANDDPIYRISLKEIASISPHPSMLDAFHFFHHALFNEQGTRLFFLHRWLDRKGRRWTRMFSTGPSGEDLYLFPMDEVVSHITWASETEIFTYARYPGRGEGYFLLEDRTGKCTRYFRNTLNSDGHPTMDKCRGYIITDTYPDRFRNQYLVLGLVADEKRIDLCRTKLGPIFKRELQVDIHPRLHPTKHIACFDSGHDGVRTLMTLDFTKALQ